MRRALGVAVCLVAGLGAMTIYTQRVPLERAWVDHRWPEVRARALAMLELGLHHPDKFIRIDSAGLLARAEDPRGFGVLIRALEDVNPIARQSAALYLVPFEERAVPPLETLLHDPEPLVRERTARAFGHMKCAEAQAVLRQEWEAGQSVGANALFDALWDSNPAVAMDVILQELRKPYRLTRPQALRTYVQNRRQYAREVGVDALMELHAEIFSTLQGLRRTDALSPQEANAIDTYLEKRMRRAEFRRHIPPGLGLSPPEEPEVRRMVDGMTPEEASTDSADEESRSNTAHRSTSDLVAALDSSDVAARIEAATILRRHPSALVIEAVDRHLAGGEPIDRVWDPLLRLLMEEAPNRAVPHLIAAVTHERFHVRAAAADMLRDTIDPAFLPVYEVALDSEFDFVRAAAVAALVRLKDHPDRRRLLVRALDDSNAANQVKAAGAILQP